jgi:dephospho-CoA kinase
VLRVGLTGGIASGKSLVATMLGEFGAALVDADEVARQVVEPGEPALAAIVEAFGSAVLTSAGELDRRRLRTEIFADDASRRRLEALLHPAIRERMLREMAAAAARIGDQPGYIVAVVPLLVETGFEAHVDRVLLVDCPQKLQLERLTRRDEMSAAAAQAMIAAQASAAERRAAADDIIDNSHSIAWTRAQTWRAHLHYLRV